jgi:deoxyribodipyrimidine photolyase-related protein
MARSASDRPRALVVFGDQLTAGTPAFDAIERGRDVVVMMEVAEESRTAPSHVQRTVMFLSAMRHFASELERDGHRVRYIRLTDPANTGTFSGEVARAVRDLRATEIHCTLPGDHRVMAMVRAWEPDLGVPVAVHPDAHFLTTPEEFAAWAAGRKQLVMEHFYRWQRKRLGVLMDADGGPVGGAWNFDAENRGAFKATPRVPKPVRFEADAITREVMADVGAALPGLPGRIDGFSWPVTRGQALEVLRGFIRDRLPRFGQYQDAMWLGQPWLYHAHLSPAMNMKLLDPREIVAAAVEALEKGHAAINAVEGFVRQIIGWREFIRGVYWLEGPGYLDRNALGHTGRLPEMYWTGETDMACMRDAIGQVLDHAYGHHIQRLMVTGNFALLAGIDPAAVHAWYLGMYADGVDWATAPNTIGMALHADGGVVGTKPYSASGKYIERMSNACEHCRFDPGQRTGEGACPFTTLYWDFLIRHRDRFATNHRMGMMVKHVDRMDAAERTAITIEGRAVRERLGIA